MKKIRRIPARSDVPVKEIYQAATPDNQAAHVQQFRSWPGYVE